MATPYPSAPYNQPAPDPCSLATFGPAWVDAPWPAWFDPDDGLSQWITPQVEGPVAPGGWYICRAAFLIPPIWTAGGDQACKVVAATNRAGFSAWQAFSFAAVVAPETVARVYFPVYNNA
ncbi:MAG TPA: hypothetical protein VMQ86_04460 [Bryobacteraceae bacterium]|nr:hypothetical protein [Bryobacteraceae bacterium]